MLEKFSKSSRTVGQSDRLKGGKNTVDPAGSRGLGPSEIVQGIYRYTRIAGAVYSVYRETTKKYIGLALYDGKEFNECGADVLVKALKDESKNRK